MAFTIHFGENLQLLRREMICKTNTNTFNPDFNAKDLIDYVFSRTVKKIAIRNLKSYIMLPIKNRCHAEVVLPETNRKSDTVYHKHKLPSLRSFIELLSLIGLDETSFSSGSVNDKFKQSMTLGQSISFQSTEW